MFEILLSSVVKPKGDTITRHSGTHLLQLLWTGYIYIVRRHLKEKKGRGEERDHILK